MTKVKEPILVDKVFNDNDFLQIKQGRQVVEA